MFPILNPPPSSLPIPSLWDVPMHQPQASNIMYRTWTGDIQLLYIVTHYTKAHSMPQVILQGHHSPYVPLRANVYLSSRLIQLSFISVISYKLIIPIPPLLICYCPSDHAPFFKWCFTA